MLFTGHSEHSIDAKLRLAVPKKYRAQWTPERDGTAWYCVPWPGEGLRLYTEKTFKALADQSEQTLTPDSDVGQLEADLFGFAERLTEDATGRIPLPKLHVELTGLGSKVVIVGAKNRLEVRDRDTWMATQRERFEALPELVARIEAKKRGT